MQEMTSSSEMSGNSSKSPDTDGGGGENSACTLGCFFQRTLMVSVMMSAIVSSKQAARTAPSR